MRLIDADALIRELNNSHYPGAPYVDAGISIAIGKVCDAPTIDHVRKGKWIKGTGENGVSTSLFCSRCNYENRLWYEWNYCPNCGAKMGEGEQNGQT